MSDNLNIPKNSLTKNQLEVLMKGRRSLYPRQFSGEKIDDNIINLLLEYANTAPNHKITRPWRFVVFSEKALLDLFEFMKEYYVSNTNEPNISKKILDKFDLKKEKTSHIIAIIMHRDEEERIPEIEEISAVACAVENIYLSLNTFDIGGYWSTGKITFSEEIRPYLNLEEKDKMMGFFYLGKVEMNIPVAQRDSVEKHVTWKK